MANVYISSHDKAAAQSLAKFINESGYIVVSTWHDDPDGPKLDLSDVRGWDRRAKRNRSQIDNADATVLIACPEGTPPPTGGKFVEAGFALGLGRPVIVFGRIENGMLNDLDVKQAKTEEDLIDLLDEI